jgi:superoxide dismutase, Cu-Zn family
MIRLRLVHAVAIGLLLCAAHGCGGGASPELAVQGQSETGDETLTRIEAPVIDSGGNVIGSVMVQQLKEDGVRVELLVEGLEPGLRAVHFHEHPRCDPPDFDSAGGHYDPTDAQHGMPRPGSNTGTRDHHAGDMFNQRVDERGTMDRTLINWSVNLDRGSNRLLADGGSSLVIHERADDYETQPAGDAGARVACAVISG